MILNVIPIYKEGDKHRVLKSTLPTQPLHSTCCAWAELETLGNPSALALPIHLIVPIPQSYFTEMLSVWDFQFCSVTQATTGGNGLKKKFYHSGIALRKAGRWPRKERWLAPVRGSPFLVEIRVGIVPAHQKTLSWNSQYIPIHEVNHETPDKKREALGPKNILESMRLRLPKYPGQQLVQPLKWAHLVLRWKRTSYILASVSIKEGHSVPKAAD